MKLALPVLGKTFLILFFCWAFVYVLGMILNANALLPNVGAYYAYQREQALLLQPLTHGPCLITDLDPFDPKVMNFIRKYPTVTCNGNIPSVVYAAGNELRVDSVKVKANLRSSAVDSCVYRNISMTNGDAFSVDYGPWSKSFNKIIRLNDQETFLHVECFHQNELVSKSYVTLVRKQAKVENERLEDFVTHIQSKKPKETLSIMLVGITGMSKENVIRAMPKTRKFLLEELGAIEFKKFNKVGMNTFSNIVPLLTGLHATELPSYWNTNKTFDNVNDLFLWNRYQKAGYRSSVVLDDSYDEAFHSLRQGWAKPPVDYFPRPVIVASEFDKKFYRRTDKNCMGQVPEISYLLDYLMDFTSVFNKTSTPYFAYSFFTRLCHNDQNKASAGDKLYLKFFRDVARKKVLRNTLLVFFSDQGSRLNGMTDVHHGPTESKLPFVYFMFPPWFQHKYLKLMETFRINTNRLVTVFDIHATLLDLLTFTGSSREVSPSDQAISLFSTIPSRRTCKEARIPKEYCAC